MEKAILRTLIYADIFDYPLKAWEIHKWLIGKKTSLSQIDKALRKLSKKSEVRNQKEYYFLPGRQGIVKKRIEKAKKSNNYLFQSKLIAYLFKLIPWINLVGVSGSLAMKNAGKKDDIDLFIVTEDNRIWLSRILILGILGFVGKRRKVTDSKNNAAGKVCINLLLENDDLAQNNKNIYVAHEILQMQILWQRDSSYNKYLIDNSWALNILPNWFSTVSSNYKHLKSKGKLQNNMINILEYLVKRLQLRYMSSPKGLERVTSTALYFHPENYQQKVLKEYKKRINRL